MFYRLIQILGNRNAGFVLCLIVVLNLAAGSLVMNMHPDLYPPFFPFDLNFFFRPAMGVHWWLYLLLVTFSLFGINLIACLLESVVRLCNTTTGRVRLYVGLLFHAAVILTLAAHFYDGFYGGSRQLMITPEATAIEGIGDVSAKSIASTYHPDGSLKDTEAVLHIQLKDGGALEKTIAYNQPALFDGAQREIIIQGGQEQPVGIILMRKDDGEEFPMMPYRPQELPGGRLTLQGVYKTKTGILVARFVWERISQQPQLLSMALHRRMARHNKITVAGKTYGYKEMIEAPVAAVMVRYNPSIPIILISLLVATIGTVLQIQYARMQSKRGNSTNQAAAGRGHA